jgi:hypothetical protein
MQAFIVDYLRPWKLASFVIGLGLLVAGADYYSVPDWDYTISFVMAMLTYLTAPWSVHVFKDRRWRWIPLALFWYYFTVDGCYWLYWLSVKPEALALREANFFASSCLYWLCGFIWLHKGPLNKLVRRSGGNAAAQVERLTLWQMISRITSTMVLFGVAYFIYSAATGRERVAELCRQITPGMDVGQLMAFAERHDLGPLRYLDSGTRLTYLAEARTLGRHACRVELEGGKVRNVTYNYAD